MKMLLALSAAALAACALSACGTVNVKITDEQKAALQADAKKLAEDAKPVIEQAAKDAIEQIKER